MKPTPDTYRHKLNSLMQRPAAVYSLPRRTALRLGAALLSVLCCLPGALASAINIDDRVIEAQLRALDDSLAHRAQFIQRRQARIDRLKAQLHDRPDDAATVSRIIDQYTSFNNDSAMHYIVRGIQLTDGNEELRFRLRECTLLPLAGFIDKAVDQFNSIDVDSVPPSMLVQYYDAGRQMYSYILGFFPGYTEYNAQIRAKLLQMQSQLLKQLPEQSVAYRFNLGEYYLMTGERNKAKAFMLELFDGGPETTPYRARVAHHLASIANAEGNQNEYIYYLTEAAKSDVSAATLEVKALQELGAELKQRDDVERAYTYLSRALDNAVTCGASMRMVESARALPLIEQAHSAQLANRNRALYVVLGIMVLLLGGMLVLLVLLRRQIRRMNGLQQNLRAANRAKEVYISQFLSLCSIYMDKLNQFCKLVNRKITVGKVDELLRLTKSGKFIEEQSREFYEVFDNAFLHIYPDFVAQVNALLRPDAQIELKEGELLNTELRILAFMRLGIQDSPRIAQVLNYSLNTIYSYRNRLKNRAINRDSFEQDVSTLSAL